jgi:hypothetical protein
MSTMAREIPTIPANMQHLPFDKRGFVVPWFVKWFDGEPEFRIADMAKLEAAIRYKLCWVCGKGLRAKAPNPFVIGPMCAINRTSSEPPSHIECARFSAKACPFLTMPKMRRREDDVTKDVPFGAGGFGLKRNPGVALLWFARSYEVRADGAGGFVLRMGDPSGVEWYCEGREATRAEVMQSIESGLPAVRAVAELQEGGAAHLEWEIARAMRWLPK